MSESFQVTIIPQENYSQTEIARKIGEYFDEKGYVFEGKKIFLKPSFVFPAAGKHRRDVTLATNTNNEVVAGVARALSNRGAAKIYIAEHRTIGPARYTFYASKIKKAVRGIDNVKMCYLDEKKRVTKTIDNPLILGYEVKYPKMLLDGSIDFFISLPKLKTNVFAGITLSVKNNFGLIAKKERLKYHDTRLHKHLASLALIKQPDLIITDAIYAGEGQGPQQTTPVNSKMLIVGTNYLAVDTVCCYLMGQNPKDVEHIRILHDRGVGPINLEEIEVINEAHLDENKKNFIEADPRLDMGPNLNIIGGREICTGGCLGMLRGILDTYAYSEDGFNSSKLGELNVIIGKDVKLSEEQLENLKKRRTIVYGDCAKKYKKYGTFFKGCPPDYTKTLLRIMLLGPLGWNPYIKYIGAVKYARAWAVHILQKIFRF